MAFSLNQCVRWVSQAGGHSTEKVGIVVAVVAPGMLPSRKDFPELYAGSGVGMSRKHESYVVRVETSKLRGSTVYRLYWPRTSALSLAEPLQAEAGLSLDGLLDALTQLREYVGGEVKVMVPYAAARVTIGASPAMPVTAAYTGIDWNAGRLILETCERLSAPNSQLQAARKRTDELAWTLSEARRASLDPSMTDAQRVARVTEILGS